jgi:hypothetical protein
LGGEVQDGKERRPFRSVALSLQVSGHVGISPPANPPLTTRDQTRVDAQARLQLFFTAWYVAEVRNDLEDWPTDVADSFRAARLDPALDESARFVLRAVQEDLRELDSPVDPQLARSVMRERLWAITALIDLDSHKRAKQFLLDVTGGAPLTICLGDVCRVRSHRWEKKTVPTTVGELGFTVQGCRAIFPDAVRAEGGEMWPGLCPGCRNPHKKLPRDQGRALNRRVNALRRGEGATIYEWSVTIPPDHDELPG